MVNAILDERNGHDYPRIVSDYFCYNAGMTRTVRSLEMKMQNNTQKGRDFIFQMNRFFVQKTGRATTWFGVSFFTLASGLFMSTCFECFEKEAMPDYPGCTLYSFGLRMRSGCDGVLGKLYYKAQVSEGNYGFWIVSIRSVGKSSYCPYKGFYPNGQIKEEGQIFVEWGSGKPFPDRHMVWNGKYYRPDGTLGSTVSQGTGTQTLWYPNGQLWWELELDNCERVRAQQFSVDGKLLSNVVYINGKEVYLEVD